jgi:hypothetical protein
LARVGRVQAVPGDEGGRLGSSFQTPRRRGILPGTTLVTFWKINKTVLFFLRQLFSVDRVG